MERLTGIISYCSFTYCDNEGKCKIENVCYDKQLYEKLKNFEDLEEQGLLLKLPYKAGERVWILYKDKLIEENYVVSIQIGEKYDRLCFADGYIYTIWNKNYEEVKKWVYTSKEEAEKALAEMGE